MKQSDKDLSKVFFNSVEEMNECYGIDVELPRGLHSSADLVCYEIVNPFVFDYMGQYVFTKFGYHHLNNLGEPVIRNHNEATSETAIVEDDLYKYEDRCFVYVRVNEYLRKHLEKTLIGCEFIFCHNEADTQNRRFVHSVEDGKLGVVVTDQFGFSTPIESILLYPDDYSDPIPYKEWVKKINEQGVED